MAELGRGAIEYRFEAVCGGCGRRESLSGSTPNFALMDAVSKKWGEDPALGMLCPRCVKKVGEAMAKAAKERREAEEAEKTRIVLTDARGNVEGE